MSFGTTINENGSMSVRFGGGNEFFFSERVINDQPCVKVVFLNHSDSLIDFFFSNEIGCMLGFMMDVMSVDEDSELADYVYEATVDIANHFSNHVKLN